MFHNLLMVVVVKGAMEAMEWRTFWLSLVSGRSLLSSHTVSLCHCASPILCSLCHCVSILEYPTIRCTLRHGDNTLTPYHCFTHNTSSMLLYDTASLDYSPVWYCFRKLLHTTLSHNTSPMLRHNFWQQYFSSLQHNFWSQYLYFALSLLHSWYI